MGCYRPNDCGWGVAQYSHHCAPMALKVTLQTLNPIWSPMIWTSIATGREAEAHGITGYYTTRSDLKAARFWDVAQ